MKTAKTCGVMGCSLQNLHAGMHMISFPSRNRKTIQKITNTKTATIRSSPSKSRDDVKISTEQLQLQAIKTQLFGLRKTIDTILRSM